MASHAARTSSSGEVRLLTDLSTTIQDKQVVIVGDIADTGITLHYLQEILMARNPRWPATASFLSKRLRQQADVTIDHTGFAISDRFVVGDGLDHAEPTRICGASPPSQTTRRVRLW